MFQKMNFKRAVTAVLLIVCLVLPLTAQTIRDTWLPDFKNLDKDYEFSYFSLDTGYLFPRGIGSLTTGDVSRTEFDGGAVPFSLEIGTEIEGYLAGVKFGVSQSHWLSTSIFKDYAVVNIPITVQLSKILDKEMLSFLPGFLSIRPSLGLGLTIIDHFNTSDSADTYYGSTAGFGFTWNVGLFADLNVGGMFTIYTGYEFGMIMASQTIKNKFTTTEYDVKSTLFENKIVLGVRMTYSQYDSFSKYYSYAEANGTPFNFAAFRDEITPLTPYDKGQNPGVILRQSSRIFSPDGDGKHDTLTLKTFNRYYNKATGKEWSFVVTGPDGKPFYTKSGTGRTPKSIKWDGKGDSGELVRSATDYKYKLSLTDTNDKKTEIAGVIEVDILIVQDGDNLKIMVPSIEFDSNAATFNKLTAEQKATNKQVLDRVAVALKKYSTYKVTIEGHANNVSGTEKEEVNELIPLSTKRAEAIKNELVSRGVDAERLSVVGVGGRKPITKAAGETWKNRRVEFILIK